MWKSRRNEEPNIHELFHKYNQSNFQGLLSDVRLRWSNDLPFDTAGQYIDRHGNSPGLIELNARKLRGRPSSETVTTLLHEMIHAYVDYTGRNDYEDHHGPNFQGEMRRINQELNANVQPHYEPEEDRSGYSFPWGGQQGWTPGSIHRSSIRADGSGRTVHYEDTWTCSDDHSRGNSLGNFTVSVPQTVGGWCGLYNWND
ncbi:hypothetical protein IWQ62_003691 [Dispira parvispora]|uniref:SprT-like domain-containing protein n=1 Tax=Dispira parvispora TaxID=1520584 RepID=A0A9W8E6U4_9FUNG|nr:hypothetical protein IWQ62_003691 [Dispira parvispora]